MSSMKKHGLSIALGALFLVSAAEVSPHAHLEFQFPAAGSTLREPPDIVRLRFSHSLKAEGSLLWIENESGDRIAEAGALRVDGALEMVCTFPVNIRIGRFHVYWRAATADRHQTRGDYWFTIQSAGLMNSSNDAD